MKIFEISGYWKDDRSEFEGYVVVEEDSVPVGMSEDEIFFYGLSEEDLKNSSEDDGLDFVITNYKIID